jgi:TatD DNase family protein
MAHSYKGVLLAVGIHPARAIPLTDEEKKQLEELTTKPGIAAFGEIGVEYHGPDGTPTPIPKIEMQKELFLYQLLLL